MDLPFAQSVAYIAKYVHVSKLNKRCVTLASVNCRPFASEGYFERFWRILSSLVRLQFLLIEGQRWNQKFVFWTALAPERFSTRKSQRSAFKPGRRKLERFMLLLYLPREIPSILTVERLGVFEFFSKASSGRLGWIFDWKGTTGCFKSSFRL